jgi:predicted PhzF superfamily epimerase YddE/YHI9
MTQPIIQVDAFTERPGAGNPAAVCLLAELRGDGWMQDVAREMNLSETAFLLRRSEGYDLRWFAPGGEVGLCGHATLAAAHVLWEDGRLAAGSEARFSTRSGVLTARRRDRWLVEIGSETVLRQLAPDLSLLRTVPMRGVMVTARSVTRDYDFISRFFAPGLGIPEDPVTGSAHCCLGPYWQKQLKRDSFTAWQASPRGGAVHVRMTGDRVLIAGKAVTVMRGELLF